MTNDDDNIKPCPFCGSDKIEKEAGDESVYYRCRACEGKSGRVYFLPLEFDTDDFSASEGAALAAWNSRREHEDGHEAIVDVLAERQRQIDVEGWTPAHDDEHDGEELAFAASCYCTADHGEAPPAVWPWDWAWWKPRDHRSNCVRAAALLLAEIERLDRRKT